MKQLSGRQKRSIEIVTGADWDKWLPEAVSAYFSFTDKGEMPVVSSEAKSDYAELLYHHNHHPVTVEQWRQDFKAGLLFLDDFLLDNYPDTYIQHAFEIYEDEMGFIPRNFRGIR